jgi:hypothetical protein
MPNTNGYGLKRAILYARVSTDEQARSGFPTSLRNSGDMPSGRATKSSRKSRMKGTPVEIHIAPVCRESCN